MNKIHFRLVYNRKKDVKQGGESIDSSRGISES